MKGPMASLTDRAVFALGGVFGLVAGVTLALAAFATAALLSDHELARVSRSPDATVQQPVATADTRPSTSSVAGVHTGPSHDFAVLGILDRDQALDTVMESRPPAKSRTALSI
jgi:hypothetical protein